MSHMTYRHDIRVYYEDTDLAGIVYYANYLRFIERGRTEMLRDLGVDQVALKADSGLVFAVRRVVAEYHLPAVMDDLLRVETRVCQVKGASITLEQRVLRDDICLFSADVTLAALANGRATRIPKTLRDQLIADCRERPSTDPS